MFNQEALERLIRKVGESSLEAREKKNSMIDLQELEREDFEKPSGPGKKNNKRASQDNRLNNTS